MTTPTKGTVDTVTLERDGHVLVMGLNRPEKRNAFTVAMLADLSRAYALLERDDTLRAGVLIAHGEHFTAGLDLVDVAPYLAEGRDPMRPRACSRSSSVDPLGLLVADGQSGLGS